jgi:hypothetical protein
MAAPAGRVWDLVADITRIGEYADQARPAT